MYYGRDNTITVKCGDREVRTYDRTTPEVKGLEAALVKGAGILPPFTATVEFPTMTVELFDENDTRTLSDAQMDGIFDALCEAGDTDGKWFIKKIRYTGKKFEIDYESM